ncbi:MAG: hypothetical protein PUK61_01025 [[Actinobacillus] rossii]|nr:hypothetical protein [[Actinobacillus] rossii]
MKITEILNIKFNYQMTESLLALLFDEEKRNTAFEQYLATYPDLSQDCFLAEFQAQFADRSGLKQDYRLTKQGKFSHIEQVALDWSDLKVDCVISNPPYSLGWQSKEDERFQGYALAPKQVFAPRDYETSFIEKISTVDYLPLFTNEEVEKIQGFIEMTEKKIEQLKIVKNYFMNRMFV